MQTSYSSCLDFACLSRAKPVLFTHGLRHSVLDNLDSPPSSTCADVCLVLSPIMTLGMNYLEREEKGKEGN